MIDLRAARNDPDAFRAALARKGAAELFDELIAADRAVLDVQPQVEELRAKRKLKGKPTAEQLAELEQVKVELQRLEEELGASGGPPQGAARPRSEPAGRGHARRFHR